MRIHQITHLFHPDALAGASLYTDMARFFRDRGHDLRVTTTFPYYPALRYEDPRDATRVHQGVFEQIPLRRIGMYLPQKHSGWRRILPEISFAWRLSRHARFRGWVPDVIITACPMLAQCVALDVLYYRKSVPRLIIVQDLMVDAAFDLGIIRSRLLGWVLKAVERWALRRGSVLSTISPEMGRRLLAHQRRIMVIPNWIHESLALNARKALESVPSRAKRRLVYSGNLGVKQGLPGFIEAFQKVGRGWRLDIYGGGAAVASVKAKVDQCSSVFLRDLLPEDEYVKNLASASACVITQEARMGANFLPSKLLPSLITGTPILAVCDEGSPLGSEVKSGGFGVVCAPGDKEGLKKILEEWGADEDRMMKLQQAAIAHAAKFNRDTILQRYEQELQLLVAEAP